MATDPGHISWKMPISSSTPPRAKTPIETPSRLWTPFIHSKLPCDQQSPILPIAPRPDASTILPSSISPHISPSTSDEALRSSLSAARAELNNSTFQIDHLRKLVLDLEQENSRLKSDNSYILQQRRVGSAPEDVSINASPLEKELRRAQAELNECEHKYHEALAQHRLQTISLEADRDAKARELTRVQQELEEITVLYKGKTRCLQQLQELHDAQSSKDGTSRSEDKKRIDALSAHITKLRDALLKLRQLYEAEKTRCADQQSRLKTMKNALHEANAKFEACNSELLSAREEIDELLSQLSELDNKRRQSGGLCIRQTSGYQSDAVKSICATQPARSSTPAQSVNFAETLPPSQPADQPASGSNQPQRVVACKDASTSIDENLIPGIIQADAIQKKLLDTEALLSAERATTCKLRTEILDMEERERESEKLCDMLQAEIEKMRKCSDVGLDKSQSVLADIKKSHPVTYVEKSDMDGSKLLELCMDECNELRRQNAELAIELERVRNELRRKDGELHKVRVRLSQRPVPLHNPLAYDLSNDETTVVNESTTQISSIS